MSRELITSSFGNARVGTTWSEYRPHCWNGVIALWCEGSTVASVPLNAMQNTPMIKLVTVGSSQNHSPCPFARIIFVPRRILPIVKQPAMITCQQLPEEGVLRFHSSIMNIYGSSQFQTGNMFADSALSIRFPKTSQKH